ncbi:TRAP transporter substrate-binding protein [Pseudooceanicola sp. CBS1P-1]|uniref:C4-dicarboxylate ABC transporter substrate-binding protein n=1 Tax=Pseudooceanicola albus TaxID=2692189 RepID=A0A6L7G655_9RHOB|nr:MULTISPECIES: TRAP transporter substrate-binding protein [Pseudooceanicola]MBT9386176.1 TRAP transporter substrate-binding protein [Pseudooceanicola endophyticus]MXN19409.1 C4-dicarboxylate ABC transporter substrate-binding protein [Pseudooceanicola albus]
MFTRGLALALLTASPSLALAETWDLPLAWPDDNYISVSAGTFADDVRKATDGRVDMVLHTGGSLGFKGPEMLGTIRDGLVPVGDMLLNQQIGEEPMLGLTSLPYFLSSFAELEQFESYFEPELEKIMAKNNQKLLYTIPWPQQQIWTKTPVSDIASLAGMKIRSYDKSSTEVFSSAGMVPVQLPWGEVIPSLAAGAIDAVATSSPSAVDGSFWEFLGYGYPTRQTWNMNAMTVNLDSWNGLSEADQTAILDIAHKLQPTFWQAAQDEDAKNMKTLAEHGLKLEPISDDLRAELAKRAAPLREATLKELGPEAQKIVDGFKPE